MSSHDSVAIRYMFRLPEHHLAISGILGASPITRKILASSFSSRVKKSTSLAAAAALEDDFFTLELKLLARIFLVIGGCAPNILL